MLILVVAGAELWRWTLHERSITSIGVQQAGNMMGMAASMPCGVLTFTYSYPISGMATTLRFACAPALQPEAHTFRLQIAECAARQGLQCKASGRGFCEVSAWNQNLYVGAPFSHLYGSCKSRVPTGRSLFANRTTLGQLKAVFSCCVGQCEQPITL